MEKISFEECFIDVTGGNIKIKQSDYLENGKIPIIDQGKTLIGGYTNDENAIAKCKLPCIVYGDHSRYIKYLEKPFAIGADGVKLLETTSKLVPKYGYYFLQTVKLPNAGYERSFKYLRRIKIPVPDLSTQNKFVTILDKVKTIFDGREEVLNKYRELVRAIFLDMFGDPVKNEKGWEKISLKDLGQWKSGGTPTRSNQLFFNGNIPWVTSGELNDLYISSTKEYITQEAINSSNAKLIPSNSLLIGMYDTAALKSSINTIPLSCNQAIAYSQINEQKCSVLYVHTAIQIGKEFFKSNQRGVRQQNLNLEMIKEITIPKPEIGLQREFEVKYHKLLTLLSKSRIAYENIQLLIDSLSQQVFSEQLIIDIDTELNSLINAIDLDRKDEENKIEPIKKDLTFIQALIDKLQEQDFETTDKYEKAKYIAFKIMKEEPDLIKQRFNHSAKKVTLEV